jgi:EpsI family protein
MMGLAVTANYAIGRLEQPKPRPLPVKSFPRQVGEWVGGEDLPLDPEVKKMLAHATVADRIYTHPSGKTVNLVLVTSTDLQDFHDPRSCFPGQGWEIRDVHPITVGGDKITAMTATRNGQTVDVYYWQTAKLAKAKGGMLAKLVRLRSSLSGNEGQSLFVRVSSPKTGTPYQTVRSFTELIQPSLKSLERAAQTH